MLSIIREMIGDYIARNNRNPDYIIIGQYALEEMLRTPHTVYAYNPNTNIASLFGIRIAKSKDRYTLNLL